MTNELFTEYGVTPVLNGRGPFTPLGVSTLPEKVREAVDFSARHFFDIAEVEARAAETAARWLQAPAAQVVYCTAAGITLAAAACLCAAGSTTVADLPAVSGTKRKIAILEHHCVNYGQPITQALALSGAEILVIPSAMSALQAEQTYDPKDIAAIQVVSSYLCGKGEMGIEDMIELGRKWRVPVVLDGAGQDLRAHDLMKTGADLVLLGSHKYMRSLRAGIVAGRKDLVEYVNANLKGIGRGMIASKEALFSVMAAIRLREDEASEDIGRKLLAKAEKLQALFMSADPNLRLEIIEDQSGAPIRRLRLYPQKPGLTGDPLKGAALTMRQGRPKIFLDERPAAQGYLQIDPTYLEEKSFELFVTGVLAALSKTP